MATENLRGGATSSAQFYFYDPGTVSDTAMSGFPKGNLNVNGTRVFTHSVSLYNSSGTSGAYIDNATGTLYFTGSGNPTYVGYNPSAGGTVYTPSGNFSGAVVGTYTWTTVPATMTVPGAVASTTVVGRINLSWTAPNNGGQTITGYRIYNGSTNALIKTIGTTTGERYVDGLTPGVSYTFKVSAYNVNGTAARSSATVAVVAPALNNNITLFTEDGNTATPQFIYAKIDGTWRTSSTVHVKAGGTWHTIT